ncbi:MAG: hypothetical protein H7A23_03305 [Leptospiraceae bacterium]|nr:hypothetical protein [Leptospiraceae bacterium]MCP5493557.1 hypothetical protein [Leptospiraceae bacterium]
MKFRLQYKNFRLSILFVLFFSFCATDYLSTVNPSKLTGETKPYTIWITIFDVPLNATVDAAEVCPGQKIGGIQLYYPSTSQTVLNEMTCYLTLTFVCPKSIGIECID